MGVNLSLIPSVKSEPGEIFHLQQGLSSPAGWQLLMFWAWAQTLPFRVFSISGPLSSASPHQCTHQPCSRFTLRITFPHLFIFHLPFHLPSMLSPLSHPTRCEAKVNRDCFLHALPPNLNIPGRWESSWEVVPRHRAGFGLTRANGMLV